MKYWFIFCKTDLLLEKKEDGTYTIPCSEESPIPTKPWTHILNITPMEDGTEVKTFTIPEPVTGNPKYEMCGLRPSFYKLSSALYQKAGKCQELNYWDMNTQFCGVCGAPMKMATDISKKCTECGKQVWPSLATAIIGISLFVVGVMICYSGVTKTYRAICGETLQQPGVVALIAAIVSIVMKEWAYQFTVKAGKKYHSEAVVANAWHHRSDALSSIGTMFGIGGAIILGEKWAVLDPLAAIIVSVFIIKAAWGLVMQSVKELTDASLPEMEEDEILKIANEEEGVGEIHNLRTRRIGNKIAIEMHVRMPGSLSLYEAHEHATHIETKLKQHFGADTHVGIHLEPIKVNGKYQKPE